MIKKSLSLVLIGATCWLLLSCHDNVEVHNVWVKRKPLDVSFRNYPAGFSIDGMGYIGIGHTEVPLTDWWQSDPSNDAWVKKKDFPGEARFYPSFTADEKYGYVGLGHKLDNSVPTYIPFGDIWRYDPSNDSWSLLTSAPFSNSFVVPIFFVLNNNLFVVVRTELWAFDLSARTWQRKKDMPFNSRYSVFERNGRSLIVNGELYFLINDRSTQNPNELAETSSFWKYDAAADSWASVRTNLSLGIVYWSGAFNIGTRIFVPSGPFQFWHAIDISDPKSEFKGGSSCALADGASSGIGYSIDGKGYIFSAHGGEYWQYVP